MNDIFYFFKRFNRKHRQVVNLSITALIFIFICALFFGYQSSYMDKRLNELAKQNQENSSMMMARQDSMTHEIIWLKAGMGDAAMRSLKVSAAASEIMKDRKMTKSEAMKLAGLVYDECERSGVEFSFALAVIQVESRFNHHVTSVAGAQGIMQIMPFTFLSVARIYGYDYIESDVTDLKKNIRVGVLFLHRLHEKTGSYDLAAAAYNGGPKMISNYKLKAAGDTTVFVPDETMRYVESVRNQRIRFKNSLGE